jgi:hypothetical protein
MNDLAERRREEKERRRDEIIDAAAAVVGEVGFEALTMGLVARVARVSRALTYTYFKDTQDLQWALCERAMERLLHRFVAEGLEATTGLSKLEAMGAAYIAFAQQEPVYFGALAHFEAHPGDSANDGCPADDKVHRVMIEAIRQGMTDGSIRPDLGNADAVATVLWGFMHGVIQLVASKGPVLTQRGIEPGQLFEQAMTLARAALQVKP